MSNTEADVIPSATSSNYVVKVDSIPSPSRGDIALRKSPGRDSTGSAMSASSEDTSDSGFYQLTPEVQGLTPGTGSISPRPSPRAIRRLSNMTESTDSDDIDFFLKVVSEFGDYVSEKIDQLEEQHGINVNHLHDLQQILKQSEESWTAHEVDLAKQINHMVALLHKQQSILMEQIKKHRAKGTDILREKMDVCRRNSKTISGVISFAKRVKNEKDDSIRKQTLKELKERFTMASKRSLPVMETLGMAKQDLGLDKLDEMKRILEDMVSGSPGHSATAGFGNKPPVILAQSSPNDVTKDSIIVRWTDDDATDDVTYEVLWKFAPSGELKKVSNIVDSQYTITDLQPSCDVTLQVKRHSASMTSELSHPAFFRTNPQPAKFHLDSDTAHTKLELSPDLFSVHYPGDFKSSIHKSPSRFTFALNVLGNISFFTGRHYWEILVNRDGWAVGVAYRNVARNSWLGSNESSWVLHYNPSKREYKARHAGESADVKIRRKRLEDEIGRVGIFIDYEAGIISFVDCHHMVVLHTYKTEGFKEPICAAVNPFYHGGVLTMITGLEIPDINFCE